MKSRNSARSPCAISSAAKGSGCPRENRSPGISANGRCRPTKSEQAPPVGTVRRRSGTTSCVRPMCEPAGAVSVRSEAASSARYWSVCWSSTRARYVTPRSRGSRQRRWSNSSLDSIAADVDHLVVEEVVVDRPTRKTSEEVGIAFVSELCHIPPQTLGQHRHLRGHAEADRCCGKSLIRSALVRFGVRQHARKESISKRAPSTTRTSLRLESTICERSKPDYRECMATA